MKKLFSEIPYIEGDRLVIRRITADDAPALRELAGNEAVYRYLPTFLFEKKYEDIGYVTDYLYNETDIEIITASTMIENLASAKVLRKNGFDLVVHAVPEDWGHEEPAITDKWIR